MAAAFMCHALGLAHYTGYNALMDANIGLITSPSLITSDDITGIRSLY
ncbi:matrixin family metalloprotease [Cohnella mopanensis]